MKTPFVTNIIKSVIICFIFRYVDTLGDRLNIFFCENHFLGLSWLKSTCLGNVRTIIWAIIIDFLSATKASKRDNWRK